MGMDMNSRKQGGGRLRNNIAKKTASLLAAVVVAGGSALVGMPEAKAAWYLKRPDYIYWEKIDQDGKPLEGATFELSLTGETLAWANDVNKHHSPEFLKDAPTRFVVTDNESAPEIDDLLNPREAYWHPFGSRLFQLTDLDPRPGHFLIVNPLLDYSVLYNVESDYYTTLHEKFGPTGSFSAQYMLSEIEYPSGYTHCDVQDDLEFEIGSDIGAFDTEALGDGKFRHTLKKTPFIEIAEGTGQDWTEVTDRNFHGALSNSLASALVDSENFSVDKLYARLGKHSEEEWVDDQEKATTGYKNALTGEELGILYSPIYAVGALPNCRVEGLPSVTTTATAEPSTVVTTTTQPPVTSTLPDTTVTNPPVTVTNPGTTVTRPDTTITQPPVVSTIPGTTITKPGTTVTEPAKTLVTTLLGTTVREPGTTVREPGTTVREPDTTVATTLREPDVTVTPDPVTVEKEKPVAVETLETETPTTETSETSVANETVSTTPETTDAVPETSSNSNDARILASTGANIMGFVAIAGLLIGIGAFAVRRRK